MHYRYSNQRCRSILTFGGCFKEFVYYLIILNIGRRDDIQTGDFRSKVQCLFLPSLPARKSAETFTKVWKERWSQLKIFKHKSYGETALKPARGSGGGGCELPAGSGIFSFFDVFRG